MKFHLTANAHFIWSQTQTQTQTNTKINTVHSHFRLPVLPGGLTYFECSLKTHFINGCRVLFCSTLLQLVEGDQMSIMIQIWPDVNQLHTVKCYFRFRFLSRFRLLALIIELLRLFLQFSLISRFSLFLLINAHNYNSKWQFDHQKVNCFICFLFRILRKPLEQTVLAEYTAMFGSHRSCSQDIWCPGLKLSAFFPRLNDATSGRHCSVITLSLLLII